MKKAIRTIFLGFVLVVSFALSLAPLACMTDAVKEKPTAQETAVADASVQDTVSIDVVSDSGPTDAGLGDSSAQEQPSTPDVSKPEPGPSEPPLPDDVMVDSTKDGGSTGCTFPLKLNAFSRTNNSFRLDLATGKCNPRGDTTIKFISGHGVLVPQVPSHWVWEKKETIKDQYKGTISYLLPDQGKISIELYFNLIVNGKQVGDIEINSLRRDELRRPSNEVCNGRDDDMNGQIDDGASCASACQFPLSGAAGTLVFGIDTTAGACDPKSPHQFKFSPSNGGLVMTLPTGWTASSRVGQKKATVLLYETFDEVVTLHTPRDGDIRVWISMTSNLVKVHMMYRP